MRLPESLNPRTVALAAAATKVALDNSPYAELPEDERAAIIERGVSHLMAAGAFVCDGKLFLPTEGAIRTPPQAR